MEALAPAREGGASEAGGPARQARGVLIRRASLASWVGGAWCGFKDEEMGMWQGAVCVGARTW